MSKSVFITIEGTPLAKARARFARRTGTSKKTGKKFDFVQTFNGQEDAEAWWVMKALEQVRKARVFFTSAVEITIWCWIQRPGNHYGTGRNSGKLKPTAPKYPAITPDLDNYEKFILDCLNHCVIWTDDKLVVGMSSKKRFILENMQPCTQIFITDEFLD